MNQPVGHMVRISTNENPSPASCDLERAADHLLGARDVAGVVHRAARHVGRAVELGDQRAQPDRVAVLLGVAPVEGVLGALAERGGGGHVPAGLAEHAVVEHEAGDALAARRGVQHLLQAFVHHVAVALHGDHEGVGLGPLRPVASDGARPWSACSTSTSRLFENAV